MNAYWSAIVIVPELVISRLLQCQAHMLNWSLGDLDRERYLTH